MPGIYRTRAGYTGGSSANPTYRSMGNHTETLEVDFDPEQISFETIMWAFFEGHRPTRPSFSRQYRSAIFVHNEEQRAVAKSVMERFSAETNQKVYTAIEDAKTFYIAEDYHQKYSLQSQHKLMRRLKNTYPDFSGVVNSTAAARINAYVSGYGELSMLQAELPSLGLDEALEERLVKQFRRFG